MTLLATQPSLRTSLSSRIRQFATEPRTLAEAVAVLYMVGVAATANGLHLAYIMFPELASLALDVLTRPYGKWAKEPWKLVVTPTATAMVGIAVGRYLPYGLTGILVIMSLSLGIILALRSAVAPAISAGVLPLVLNGEKLALSSLRWPGAHRSRAGLAGLETLCACQKTSFPAPGGFPDHRIA